MEYFIDKLVDAIIGCIFGIVAYICTRSLDKRIRNFIVARKIDSLLKEIKEGLDIMKNELRNSLPEKSWKEEFITKEDILIISAVSKSEKVIKMLEHTKFLLEKNYKKRLFPK